MLISFRQTYGDGRDELFEIFSRDQKLIDLYNLCDLNIHSFHNCSKETIERYKNLNRVKNSEYLEFNDINYLETIKELKKKLKELKCSHFLFTQDDTFIAAQSKNVDWKELVDYAKSYDKDFMVNLYHRIDILTLEGETWEGEINEQKTFKVYKSTTQDFYDSEKTPWPMDDSPYICTIDILDEIYDDEYFGYEDIWDAEKFLRRKYSKKKINRFVTDKKMLQNYNIYGKTTYMEFVFRQILKTNGLT